MRIDLHVHSTASDGTETPAEVVRTAADGGLDVIALTDHDTTAGWAEAAAALPAGLRLVPGAELSCLAPDGRGGEVPVHLLAYLFDPESPAVVAEQIRLQAERRTRLRRMAERMANDGFPIDVDQLMAELPPTATAGRPHLARALLEAGVVSTVDEAFERYLASGGPYYLGRTDTPVHRAIDMINAAGGATVLAHAFARARGPVVTAEVIAELSAHGLAGLEVDHPDHDAASRAELRALAEELDLVVTGSSDYHGDNKTTAIGAETTHPEQFERLLDRVHPDRLLIG
ncbi:phosphatase [Longimycelium tulufanense]|uniref:Phosphatase n=1 Tax=Longimycelium tulufanense TaxID=907463 RepID=A0A8J3FSU2_9PSEU|nr:PHP domain-containing protein [Longimycelium tulufanense]GGM42466.1 phosphatase [Longimycelium tulufanense]